MNCRLVLLGFNYCDIVWAPIAVSSSKPLELLHSHFLQQVPDCNSFVKMILAEPRCFHTVVQVFKVLYQLCLGYLKDWFVFAETYTEHSSQNKCRLFILKINTSIGMNGVLNQVHEGHKTVHSCFLEIALVHMLVCVYVCVCLCLCLCLCVSLHPPLRALITSGMIWCDI